MSSLSTQEVMARFGIKSTTTALQLFKTNGSPAYKVGKNWMVDEDDFKSFLQKQSEKYKG
jgi:hypothetical protein